MKKLILITGFCFLLFISFLAGIYFFLDVPYKRSAIDQIVSNVQSQWNKSKNAEPSQLLESLNQFVQSFDEKLGEQDPALKESWRSMAQTTVLSGQNPTSLQIAQFKKIFNKESKVLWDNVLNSLLQQKATVMLDWIDPNSEAYKARPSVIRLKDFFDLSVLYAEWCALTGDWTELNRISEGQIRLVQSLLEAPSKIDVMLGLALRNKLITHWLNIGPALNDVSRQSLVWPNLGASLKSLAQVNLTPLDIVQFDLYEFHLITDDFNSLAVKQVRLGAGKGLDFLFKPLFIRDRKIGLMKLYNLTQVLKEDKHKIKSNLEALSKTSRLTPVSNVLLPDYKDVFDQIKTYQEKAAEFLQAIDKPVDQFQSLNATQIVIPQSLYVLFTPDEMRQLGPRQVINSNVPQTLLDGFKKELAQPFFSTDLFESFSQDSKVYGVFLGLVQPGSFYEAIGLMSGDVLLSIDGIAIEKLDFENVLTQLDTNKTMSLHVVRQNNLVVITIKVI